MRHLVLRWESKDFEEKIFYNSSSLVLTRYTIKCHRRGGLSKKAENISGDLLCRCLSVCSIWLFNEARRQVAIQVLLEIIYTPWIHSGSGQVCGRRDLPACERHGRKQRNRPSRRFRPFRERVDGDRGARRVRRWVTSWFLWVALFGRGSCHWTFQEIFDKNESIPFEYDTTGGHGPICIQTCYSMPEVVDRGLITSGMHIEVVACLSWGRKMLDPCNRWPHVHYHEFDSKFFFKIAMCSIWSSSR